MTAEKSKCTCVELFAGAGGLALGLEKAGFVTSLATDNDKWAVETLLRNRPSWNILREDVRVLSSSGVRQFLEPGIEVDLLSGGYPCQAFSYAGKKLGMKDVRGTLFHDFAKILRELRPRVFLAENVKGLLSHDGGRTLATMVDVFEQEGYVVSYQLLSAVDYEVAQKRNRVFIVGVREDVHRVKGEYDFPEKIDRQLVLRDVLQNVPDSDHAEYSAVKKEVFKHVPPGGYWRHLPDDMARSYMGKSYFSGGGKTGIARRLAWEEPALTVLTSPSQKQTERIHPDELRPLSVRENARIQCFPDSWEFAGPLTAQYKQIGNAVPVMLGYHMARSLYTYLQGDV